MDTTNFDDFQPVQGNSFTAIVSPIVGVTSGTISIKGTPAEIIPAITNVLPNQRLVVFVRYQVEDYT